MGAVYKHWPAKTVTEADDHLFCLLTMNHHPLHINDVYAAESQQGRNVVVGPLVYSLALGMSVGDVSGKAIANLATEELSHPAPVFHGDTLFCESEVLDVQPSQSKPDRGVVQGPHPRLQAGRHARGRVQARRAGAAQAGLAAAEPRGQEGRHPLALGLQGVGAGQRQARLAEPAAQPGVRRQPFERVRRGLRVAGRDQQRGAFRRLGARRPRRWPPREGPARTPRAAPAARPLSRTRAGRRRPSGSAPAGRRRWAGSPRARSGRSRPAPPRDRAGPPRAAPRRRPSVASAVARRASTSASISGFFSVSSRPTLSAGSSPFQSPAPASARVGELALGHERDGARQPPRAWRVVGARGPGRPRRSGSGGRAAR